MATLRLDLKEVLVFCRGYSSVIILKKYTSLKQNYIYYNKYSIYNMSGRVVSDIQTRAEGARGPLYVRYNTDASIL